MTRYMAILFLFWSAGPALAGPYDAFFQNASVEMGVQPELTRAIAQVESGISPYALNIEGKSYFFDSKGEALAAAHRAEEAGLSFDSGLMQINNWWLRRFDLPVEALFDPEANVLFGSYILSSELERSSGDTWQAVGRYHSPKTAQGSHYAELVRQALKKGPQPAGKKPRRAAQAAAANTKKEKTGWQAWLQKLVAFARDNSGKNDAPPVVHQRVRPAETAPRMVIYRDESQASRTPPAEHAGYYENPGFVRRF